MPEFVMVLNDGETWTNLDGCVILKFDEEPTDEEIKRAGVNHIVARFSSSEDGRAEVHGWRLVSSLDSRVSLYSYPQRPEYVKGPIYNQTTGDDLGRE
jgi:hypothetical protein